MNQDFFSRPFQIIDISQPVSSQTACFPGDVPFSRDITLSYQDSNVINLCAFTMSPHVGTHADAPVHVQGDLNSPQETTAGQLPLEPYIGPVTVINIAPWTEAITWAQVQEQLETLPSFPTRILFKTQNTLNYNAFEPPYAWLSKDLIKVLTQRGVMLVGLDTPSVDHVDSKTLDTHHALINAKMFWLENLDLSRVPVEPQKPQQYFLLAAPLKFISLEASPLRAVLLA